MTLIEKVQAVEAVFAKLDEHIRSFQDWSGFHCRYGCGKCCFKPDIEATALEFLPFAHHLYQQEMAFEWLEKVKAGGDLCMILDPVRDDAGLCTEYKHRGLICRLFGYSARTDKYGKKELVTCQVIKSELAPQYEDAKKKVAAEEGTIPVMHQYYLQLSSIDPQLAQDFYPINVAIRRAIETVLQYYAYRN